MRPDPVSIVDLATIVFVEVDDAIQAQEHPQAKLSLSELLTIGLLFSLKGGSFHRFYRWLVGNLGECFPTLPERSRLQRRLIQHQGWVQDFLVDPSLFCVADSYGIELRHPVRELQPPKTQRIGNKGKSNRRWIHGMKVLLLLNDQDQVVNFALSLASPADKHFNPLLAQYNQQTIILVDLGFRDKLGIPECLKLCLHKTWGERMSIERLFSQLTRFMGAKKRNHRTEQGLLAWWSYLIIAINLIASLPNLSLADCIL